MVATLFKVIFGMHRSRCRKHIYTLSLRFRSGLPLSHGSARCAQLLEVLLFKFVLGVIKCTRHWCHAESPASCHSPSPQPSFLSNGCAMHTPSCNASHLSLGESVFAKHCVWLHVQSYCLCLVTRSVGRPPRRSRRSRRRQPRLTAPIRTSAQKQPGFINAQNVVTPNSCLDNATESQLLIPCQAWSSLRRRPRAKEISRRF